jgi:hypothetical protein
VYSGLATKQWRGNVNNTHSNQSAVSLMECVADSKGFPEYFAKKIRPDIDKNSTYLQHQPFSDLILKTLCVNKYFE